MIKPPNYRGFPLVNDFAIMTTSYETLATSLFELWTGTNCNEELESWLDILQVAIENDDKNIVNFLIKSIGKADYEILKALCTPKKPKEEAIANLVKMLKE